MNDIETLQEVERRVLWLATRIVDAANRRGESDIKVGGHQASCASMVSIMTALWFGHIGGADKVAVKPHASPVYHAIKYLTGELDRSYLTTLRQRGGLQAYPSRTKDPDVSDFSTGSVGLGAVAPLFSALTRRYVDDHFGERPDARFIALVGDAELDEGNVWEAIADPATQGLGNFTMVVDLNRQSLDRVIPDIAATRLKHFFADAGWHVAEAKYGKRLQDAFAGPDGEALRDHIDAMSNEAYQSLFALDGDALRTKFLANADGAVQRLAERHDDAALKTLVTDLGGHDLSLLLDTFAECDRHPNQPSVVFAYTIKGYGLPIAGDPLNHAALLSSDQIDAVRSDMGLDESNEWDRFAPDSAPGRLCASVGSDINNPAPVPRARPAVPESARPAVTNGTVSTQEAFGRVLASLADVGGLGERIVTTAPDVSISTNLGGWINKTGVYSHVERDDHGGADRLLKWAPAPTGRHIELGISEMNLFMLLGQLGLSHDHHDEQLFPIGTVYDPFVLRGLDAFVYGLYNASRFIVTGTPSGVTLAPEGGAHQSTITASVGAELPGLHYAEPAYATEVDWLLCDAIDALARPDGESTYLRLSTRPLDQAPFAEALERYGDEVLRKLVIAGGYRLRDVAADDRPGVTIVTTGAMAPEALAAADELDSEGVAATVVHLTSPDRVYRSWRAAYAETVRSARVVRVPSQLHRLVPPAERRRPIVSVHDAASHSLAWIGSALGVPQYALGVDRFGESGTIADLHDATGISAGSIVNAALIAIGDHDLAEW
ncbi:pyruvate dehydrogenase E1 component [Ilumatobacter fluminis]|uniref:Pyruvate dehydrogenase E1 component n=1 Tax=Ilumatobacter fluminis TaxID=467091 RepID=A0A4R7I6L6_9ACTN|nr:transketolase C-terminal domain-containing protein [Ilumatobacter fluminis]TDT18423.1 pyruvate dehydrogenase E1 component [Ilumatobacter fluminis]